MPAATLTAPVEITFVVQALTPAVISRTDFHKLIYVDDLNNCFFNEAEFAEQALYQHASLGSTVTYQCLFDDPYTSLSIGGDTEVTTVRPCISVAETSLRHVVVKGDRCTVRGITYFVDDYQSDGVGVVKIYLRRN